MMMLFSSPPLMHVPTQPKTEFSWNQKVEPNRRQICKIWVGIYRSRFSQSSAKGDHQNAADGWGLPPEDVTLTSEYQILSSLSTGLSNWSDCLWGFPARAWLRSHEAYHCHSRASPLARGNSMPFWFRGNRRDHLRSDPRIWRVFLSKFCYLTPYSFEP